MRQNIVFKTQEGKDLEEIWIKKYINICSSLMVLWYNLEVEIIYILRIWSDNKYDMWK